MKNRKEYYKQYHKDNIEDIKQRQRLYRQSIAYKKYKVEYITNRRKLDVRFRIKGTLSNRVRNALRGTNKSVDTLSLIGCDINFLMYRIQIKFKKGMNWDNRTKWHIDHIIPSSKFNLTKPREQRKCFHYTNLQPLWAKDNISKGNNLPKKYKWTKEGWVFN